VFLSNRFGQNSFLVRDCDQVNMIGHQTIRAYFHPGLLTPMAPQAQIGAVIIIKEKYILPPVPPMGNMMGKSRNHSSCYPGHGWIFSYNKSVLSIIKYCPWNSGQIPIDPSTGEMVKGDIRWQTRQVLENMKRVLESQGLGMEDVVKVNIFLKDMGNFSPMNEVYATYFSSSPPSRSTVEVAKLPRNAEIEIEAIALTRTK